MLQLLAYSQVDVSIVLITANDVSVVSRVALTQARFRIHVVSRMAPIKFQRNVGGMALESAYPLIIVAVASYVHKYGCHYTQL